VLCGLTLLLYFSHVVALIMAMAGIGIAEIGFVIRDRRRPPIVAAMTFAPAILLTAAFFFSQGRGYVDRLSPPRLLENLLSFEALVAYTHIEAWLAIGVAIIFAAAIIGTILRMRRGLIVWDSLAIAALVALAMYFLVPNSATGGGQISFRLSLFVYFFLILWLAGRTLEHVWLGIIPTIAISLAMIAVNVATAARISRYISDFVSIAPHIPTHSTLLPVRASWDDYLPDGQSFTHKVRPLLLAAGYVAAERGVIDLKNYEASQGYFPLLWREPIDAIKPDYIVLWQTGRVDPNYSKMERIQLLDATYEHVYTSPHGWAKLYHRRDAK
jgi:hypothetical protein